LSQTINPTKTTKQRESYFTRTAQRQDNTVQQNSLTRKKQKNKKNLPKDCLWVETAIL
jgi:hypothetical protein